MHIDTIKRLKEISNFQSVIDDNTIDHNWRERPELYDNVIDITNKKRYITRVSLDEEYSECFVILAKDNNEAYDKVEAKIKEMYGFFGMYIFIPIPILADEFVIVLNDIDDFIFIY